jgi:hypothetical protein
VIAEGTSIRVEMIREARIALGPAARAAWTKVPVLSITDTFAEKLLESSDRWPDRDDLSRDLLDLAVLRMAHGPVPEAAWSTVESAYGTAPRQDLHRAAERFLGDPDYQERCFTGLDVEGADRVLLGVQALLADLDAAPATPSSPA